MMGRSHLIISTGLTISILGMANAPIDIPVVAISIVSALLPDIDEPNSLIVSKTIPTKIINLFKLLLLGFAAFIFMIGNVVAPWNTIVTVLAIIVVFVPIRTFRISIMVLSGMALIYLGYNHFLTPWGYIIGSLLIICAIVPHRGLTHTFYGAVVWAVVLYSSWGGSEDNNIWIAGTLSYLIHLLADALTNRGIRPLPPFKFRIKLSLMNTGRLSGTLVENVCIGLTLALLCVVFFRDIDATSLTIGWGL